MKSNNTPSFAILIIISAIVTNVGGGAFAFQTPALSAKRRTAPATVLYDTSQVEEIMSSQYPVFMKLIMSKNADLWKKLSDASSEGFTIFAPTDDAMRGLGEKRLSQLDDVRNGETAEKMASFHAIGEQVTADALYNSGGVVTIGGVIDVGRSRSVEVFLYCE